MADAGLWALFVIATFFGAFVAGLAGFAFGLVAAAIWLHILTPLQFATLIVCYGLIVQGYAVWKLRHALDGRRLLPLVISGQLGIPLGIELLRWLRAVIGVVLIAFSLHSLLRPKLPPLTDAGPLADGAAGVASGIVGGGRSRRYRASLLLFLGGLPALAGSWPGLRLYGRLDEAGFRVIVLGLLLLAGVALLPHRCV